MEKQKEDLSQAKFSQMLKNLHELSLGADGRKPELLRGMAEFAQKFGDQAVPPLKEFLFHADWEIRCGALRALGITEAAEARSILENYVRDGWPTEDAAQATLALGVIEDPAVSRFLINRFSLITNPDLRRAVLDVLAGRPYSETASFFRAYLADSRPSLEEKSEAIANLGFQQEAPVETLLPWIEDPREEIRAGAYEGLAARREGNYGNVLLGRAAKETDPEIRQKAYEAAGAQRDTLPIQLAVISRKETNPAARLRAERAWGMTVGRSKNPEDRRKFDVEVVPRLQAEALQNPDPGEQRAALQALALARTDGAVAALENISRETKSPRLSRLAASLARKLRPLN